MLLMHWARRAASRAACTAGNEQGDQDGDDGDDDQELDQREALARSALHGELLQEMAPQRDDAPPEVLKRGRSPDSDVARADSGIAIGIDQDPLSGAIASC